MMGSDYCQIKQPNWLPADATPVKTTARTPGKKSIPASAERTGQQDDSVGAPNATPADYFLRQLNDDMRASFQFVIDFQVEAKWIDALRNRSEFRYANEAGEPWGRGQGHPSSGERTRSHLNKYSI